jgi:hypothetical protein
VFHGDGVLGVICTPNTSLFLLFLECTVFKPILPLIFEVRPTRGY